MSFSWSTTMPSSMQREALPRQLRPRWVHPPMDQCAFEMLWSGAWRWQALPTFATLQPWCHRPVMNSPTLRMPTQK